MPAFRMAYTTRKFIALAYLKTEGKEPQATPIRESKPIKMLSSKIIRITSTGALGFLPSSLLFERFHFRCDDRIKLRQKHGYTVYLYTNRSYIPSQSKLYSRVEIISQVYNTGNIIRGTAAPGAKKTSCPSSVKNPPLLHTNVE